MFTTPRRFTVFFGLTLVCLATANAQESVGEKEPVSAEQGGWITLTDRWEPALFGGEGEVTVEKGVITMLYGDPITGVSWTGPFEDTTKPKKQLVREKLSRESAFGPSAQLNMEGVKDTKKENALPRDNYEVRWECRRDDGYDFLCAFTFPIADQSASLVMGGWGGGTTGISSIDGNDASSNETTTFRAFENDRWYKARVRVESEKITVWIDGEKLFDHPRKGHTFDIRGEMDPCKPMGIANFQCDSRVRQVQVRRLNKKAVLR
ncbi:MAG: family 16 glycoside hydrolase [Planctomycetota bacterium]